MGEKIRKLTHDVLYLEVFSVFNRFIHFRSEYIRSSAKFSYKALRDLNDKMNVLLHKLLLLKHSEQKTFT